MLRVGKPIYVRPNIPTHHKYMPRAKSCVRPVIYARGSSPNYSQDVSLEFSRQVARCTLQMFPVPVYERSPETAHQKGLSHEKHVRMSRKRDCITAGVEKKTKTQHLITHLGDS